MKKSNIYAITGNGTKIDNMGQAVKDYLTAEFLKEGTRLGLPNFNKKFGKWNDEKMSVPANSLPSAKQIQLACYSIAIEKAEGEFIAIFDSENSTPIVRTVKKSNDIMNRYFSGNKTRKTEFNPTALICGLMNSDKYKFDADAIGAIELALKGLKAKL